MKEKKKEIIVENGDILFNIVKKIIKDVSNKTIKNYIKHEMVLVDDRVITNPNYFVNSKSVVTTFFRKTSIPIINLKIIYEDDDLIVIDKPSGLLSISNSQEKEVTAFRIVSDYLKTNNKYAKIFVVHRLDEQTSGVLLFAKNEKIKEKLQKQWNDLVQLREYICVVKGKTPKSDKIESYLTMNHFQIVHSTKNKEVGNLAITRYERLNYKNTYSLLRVEIDTGRRNQIRVHLSEKGFPIVGDKKYGSKINPINRLALHASTLKIIDPRNNKLLVFNACVPKEIISLVE